MGRVAREVVAMETNRRLWEAYFTSDQGKMRLERLRRMLNNEPYEEPEENHVEVLRRLFGRPEAWERIRVERKEVTNAIDAQ